MALRPRSVVATLLVVCGVAVAVFAVVKYRSADSRPSEPGPIASYTTIPRPAPRDDSYVGSQACVECHQEISEHFLASPMGRSMATIDQAVQIENYQANAIEPSKNRRYTMTRDGKFAIHSEIMLDEDGESFFEQGERVSFVVGSGRDRKSVV